MGGRAGVESEPGRGSIVLGGTAGGQGGRDDGAERDTVMLVEDDPDDVRPGAPGRSSGCAWSTPLRSWRATAEAALDYLAGRDGFGDRGVHPLPSLILLDLKLPKVSGHEVLSWLREQEILKTDPRRDPLDARTNVPTSTGPTISASTVICGSRCPSTPSIEMLTTLNVYWLLAERAARRRRDEAAPVTGSGDLLRLLVVEDDHDDFELTVRELDRAVGTSTARRVDTKEGLRSALADEPWDVVVCDFSLGSFQAPEALADRSSGRRRTLPFIVVVGNRRRGGGRRADAVSAPRIS